MKKKELKLLWPFYFEALTASAFSVVLPVWVIFFQDRFSFVQISFALSIQSLAAIMFEVPTGAIADTFGRKISVVLGITLQGCLWLVLPFIEMEVFLYSAFFLMGTLRTLESGADKAWVIDWLKSNRAGGMIHDMFIKIQSLSSAGCVISSLFASLLLFNFEIKYLFFVQGLGYIFESMFLLFFAGESIRRRKRTANTGLFHEAFHATKKGVKLIFKSRPLLYLMAATAFAVCSKDFGCLAWQPFLVGLSLPVEYLGIVFSTCSLIGIITPFLTKKLLKLIGHEKYYLSLTTVMEFVLLVSLYFINKPYFSFGIAVYIFIMVISDLQSPVGSLFFQSLIPSKIRATMGSVQSMIFAVFSLIITIIGGYVMDEKGPKTAIICFAFFLVPATILYSMIKNKTGHPSPGRRRAVQT